jgi:hypothetical protein
VADPIKESSIEAIGTCTGSESKSSSDGDNERTARAVAEKLELMKSAGVEPQRNTSACASCVNTVALLRWPVMESTTHPP